MRWSAPRPVTPRRRPISLRVACVCRKASSAASVRACMNAGSGIFAENRNGSGSGRNITINAGGSVVTHGPAGTLGGAVISSAALQSATGNGGTITITSGGPATFEAGNRRQLRQQRQQRRQHPSHYRRKHRAVRTSGRRSQRHASCHAAERHDSRRRRQSSARRRDPRAIDLRDRVGHPDQLHRHDCLAGRVRCGRSGHHRRLRRHHPRPRRLHRQR